MIESEWRLCYMGNAVSGRRKIRDIIELAVSILLVIFTIIGTYLMFTNSDPGAGLVVSGIENLKFFTVLSNEFCGIAAAVNIVLFFRRKKLPVLVKLIASSGVGLTFVIIAFFLAPMYPKLNLYSGGNLWFHLIIPLTSMAGFIIATNDGKIPFRYTFISALMALVYGTGYLINILVNGIGEWPDSNDWYGFLNWGFPIGIGIFAAVVIMNWGVAAILRLLNKVVSGLFNRK